MECSQQGACQFKFIYYTLTSLFFALFMHLGHHFNVINNFWSHVSRELLGRFLSNLICRVPYSGKVWRGGSLANSKAFSKLKQSKLFHSSDHFIIIIISCRHLPNFFSPATFDEAICQTLFPTKHFRYTVTRLQGIYDMILIKIVPVVFVL